MRCQTLVGRLVSHPCSAHASGRCPRCGRAFCARHAAPGGACAQCAGLYQPPSAPIVVSEAELMTFDEAELAAFDQPGAVPIDDRRDS